MTAIFAWWGGSAAALIALGLLIGLIATGQLLGLLIDTRGRHSLTHMQLSLWTIVILSLVAGVRRLPKHRACSVRKRCANFRKHAKHDCAIRQALASYSLGIGN